MPDQEARIAGELVTGLRDDLNDQLFGDELAARAAGAVQTVGLIASATSRETDHPHEFFTSRNAAIAWLNAVIRSRD